MAISTKADRPSLISCYWAVVSARYRMLLQYRAAAFAGFTTQLFWGAIKLMILGTFFASSDAVQPMSFAQVVAYIWLGQALLGLLPWNTDGDLAGEIRSGGVTYELLRPVDLYAFWFMRTLAYRCATTTLRMIPMILFAGLVLPLTSLAEWALLPPPSAAALVAFLVSLTATIMLATAVTMLMHIALIWTISGDGFNRLMPGIVSVFSGLTVPLPLFPDFLQGFLYWQPFRGLADTPFRIYSGNIPVDAAAFEIMLQVGWAAVMTALGYGILRRATRQLVIQGG